MREKRILRAMMGIMLVAGAVSAATQWWDASTNSGLQAGTGVWSTVDAFWATNGNPVSGNGPFAWVNGNDAVFTVVATATVNGVSANSISAQAGDPGVLLIPGAGALTNGAGGIAMTNNFLSISCPIVLGADQTWSINAAKNQKFDGAVGGPGHLTVRMSGGAYNGTFTLTNAANAFNTFTTYGVGGSPSSYGALSVAAGTLGGSLTLGVPGGSATNGANLTINGVGSTLTSLNVLTNASPAVLTLAISGTTNLFSAGGLVRLGHATCELTGPNGTNIQASIAGLSLNNNIVAPWLINVGNEFWTVGANGLTNASSASVFSASSSTQYVKIGASVASTNLTASVAAQALNMNNNPINLNGNTLSIGDGTYAGLIARNTLYGSPGIVDFGTAEALIYVNNGQYSTNFCRISGAGGLVKFGNGLLTLASDTPYAGPIWLNNGTLSLSPTAAITCTNTITGPANLTKDGTNTLTLSGTSVIGSVAVNAGTLAVSATGVLTNMAATLGGTTNGTLLVSGGGSFFAPLAAAGSCAASCNVTLTDTNAATGASSVWNAGGGTVSSYQPAGLSIANGAVVTNCGLYRILPPVSSAYYPGGTLLITNGGAFFCVGATIGSGDAGNYIYGVSNTAIVVGSNPATGRKSVWDLGHGALNVGGNNGNNAIDNWNRLLIGADGVVTNAAALNIPLNSQGGDSNTVTMTGGAQFYSTSAGLGNSFGNYNRLSLDGLNTYWNNGGGTLYIGNSGAWADNGNQVMISNSAVATNVGAITVGSPGSHYGCFSNNISILSGGSLYSTGVVVVGSGSYNQPSLTNFAIVSGAPSFWNAGGGALTVNYASQGAASNNWLWIDQGAVVTNVGTFIIGQGNAYVAAYGLLVVTNGGSLFSRGAVTIGQAHDGTQQPNPAHYNGAWIQGGTAGGALWNLGGASVTIGSATGANGPNTATGNYVRVGNSGVMTNIGVFKVGNGAGTYGGYLMLAGGGVSTTNLAMYSGTNNQVFFNSGLLQLKTAAVTNGLPFWVGDGGASPAEMNLNGGTNASQALSFYNGLVITNNGVLSGSGRIVSPTTIAGTLAPGGVGATTSIVFTSNLTLTATAVVKIDLAGKAFNLADQINATGQTVDLGGATLQVKLAPGYTPARTDVFTNLVAGILSNSFGNLVGGRVILTQPAATMTVSTTGNRVILSSYSLSQGTCVLFQ